jgi:hypothetical protein
MMVLSSNILVFTMGEKSMSKKFFFTLVWMQKEIFQNATLNDGSKF